MKSIKIVVPKVLIKSFHPHPDHDEPYYVVTLLNGMYADGGKFAANRMKKTYESNRLSDPKIISKANVKAATVKKPKTRYLLGFRLKPGVFMRRILSDKMYDRIAKKLM